MGLPAMQAQRPEPTGETIGRAIEPWMKVGLKYLILWDVSFKDKTWIFDDFWMFSFTDKMYI